jgi:hypothetical protein
MSQLRDEAEALAAALESGVCKVGEVISWADAQIMREDSPATALCEVALSYDRYPQDVAALLRKCPEAPDRSRAQRLLILLLHDRLKHDTGFADKVASAHYQMALSDEFEDPQLKSMAFWAWDALELADAGYSVESRAQITKQIAATLDHALRSGDTCWSFSFG